MDTTMYKSVTLLNGKKATVIKVGKRDVTIKLGKGKPRKIPTKSVNLVGKTVLRETKGEGNFLAKLNKPLKPVTKKTLAKGAAKALAKNVSKKVHLKFKAPNYARMSVDKLWSTAEKNDVSEKVIAKADRMWDKNEDKSRNILIKALQKLDSVTSAAKHKASKTTKKPVKADTLSNTIDLSKVAINNVDTVMPSKKLSAVQAAKNMPAVVVTAFEFMLKGSSSTAKAEKTFNNIEKQVITALATLREHYQFFVENQADFE